MQQISVVSSLESLLSISYYLKLMIFTNHLIKITGMFLDISEAFDKVWYKVIIFKLKQNDISGNLLELLAIF